MKPPAEHGGDRTKQGDNVTLDRGNNSDYLVRRLKRDGPEVAQALARGEYPSARAAGRAAGIVKIPSPPALIKKAWAKASNQDRDAFIEWIKQP